MTPNIAGASTANIFLYTPQRIDNANAFDVKVDHQFNDNDSAFLRYSYSHDAIFQPGILPTPLVGANISGPANQPAHQAVLSETHIFSPTLLNTLRFGCRASLSRRPIWTTASTYPLRSASPA